MTKLMKKPLFFVVGVAGAAILQGLKTYVGAFTAIGGVEVKVCPNTEQYNYRMTIADIQLKQIHTPADLFNVLDRSSKIGDPED